MAIGDDEQSRCDVGATAETRQAVLDQLPQTGCFRFLDTITELSESHIVARYHFRGDEWFYQGHFHDEPVTPGVILIEAMAQAGLVALGLFLLSREGSGEGFRTLFSECEIEFLQVVYPGQSIHISAKREFWRKKKLRSQVEVRFDDGTLVAQGAMAGIGVALKKGDPS